MRRLRILLRTQIPLSLHDFPLGKVGFSKSLILIEFCILHDLHPLRYISSYRLISPEIPVFLYFFFCECIVDKVCEGIIEIKWIHRSREEIPECPISFHRSKYLLREDLPFFFGILFIENAVRLVLESDTSDTMMRIIHILRVVYIRTISNLERTVDIMSPNSSCSHNPIVV